MLRPGRDRATVTPLGSIRLAIGVVSLPGVRRPRTFAPIFLVQLVYKLVRLAVRVLPTLLAGRSLPPAMWVGVGIFVLLVVEFPIRVGPARFGKGEREAVTAA